MKKCEKCGETNEADVSFCVNCGEKLLNATSVPKNHNHKAKSHGHTHTRINRQERPAVDGNLRVDQKKGATQYCENCGTANEADAKFCLSCGNSLSGNSSLPNNQMNRSYRARPMTAPYTNDEDIMQLQSAPNPVMMIWNNLLFPEKMIAVGAILNCLVAIFWVADSYLSLPMAIFYFVTMVASLLLIHLSRGVTLLKKAEFSRWQVAIGAFWLSWLLNLIFSMLGYLKGNSGLLVFNTIFSGVMLSGAIMLQGILLKHVFQQKNK